MPYAPLLEFAQYGSEAAGVAGPLQRHAARDRGRGARPNRDQRQVVGQALAVPGDDVVRRRVNALDASDVDRGAVVSRHPHHVVAAGFAQPEGLRNRERAVGKLGRGRDELDGDAFLGEFTQRHERLQRRDASAGDQHLHRNLAHDQSSLFDSAGWPVADERALPVSVAHARIASQSRRSRLSGGQLSTIARSMKLLGSSGSRPPNTTWSRTPSRSARWMTRGSSAQAGSDFSPHGPELKTQSGRFASAFP